MGKGIAATLIVLSGALAISGYEGWRLYMSEDKQLVRGCQALVLDRLVSPSTAKFQNGVVGHGQTAIRARLDMQKASDMLDQKPPQTDEAGALLDAAKVTSRDGLGEVVIDFDSMNRMSAMIRGNAICTYRVNTAKVPEELASLAVDRIE